MHNLPPVTGGPSHQSYNPSENEKNFVGIAVFVLTILVSTWYANRSLPPISANALPGGSSSDGTTINKVDNAVNKWLANSDPTGEPVLPGPVEGAKDFTSIERSRLLEELVKDLPRDEQHFLDYVSMSELKRIKSLYSDPLVADLAGLIKEGRWEVLRTRFSKIYTEAGKNERVKLFSILSAACCQQKISLLELADAYSVLSLSGSTTHSVQVWKDGKWGQKQLQWIKQVVDKVPKNQQYMLIMDLKAINPLTANTIQRSFRDGNLSYQDHFPWVFYNSFVAIPSLGLLNAHLITEKHPLRIYRGISPRLPIYRNLLEENPPPSSFALLQNPEIYIHGIEALPSAFPLLHDIFHQVVRVHSGFLEERELIEFGRTLEEAIQKLPNYSDKTKIIDRGVTWPQLKLDNPTDDLVRLILENFSSAILDGELPLRQDNRGRSYKGDTFGILEIFCRYAINDALNLSPGTREAFNKEQVPKEVLDRLIEVLNPLLAPYGREVRFWQNGLSFAKKPD